MKIIHLNENVVDVFTGKGWDNWTRFEIKFIKGKVYPKKIGGQAMESRDFQTLLTELTK